MATAQAARLDVPLQLVEYENPGLLADAAGHDEWDVGLIGAEPARAETIAFTQHYAEIEATSFRGADRSQIRRGDAAAATWIFRGDESRRAAT